MNIDKNLIEKWKMLFESGEARENGDESFLEEGDLDKFRARQVELLKNVKAG